MSKKINRQLIQNILSKGDGVKSVSSEAVDWVISVAEHTARQLATSGRRTPAGRLMAPKMDPGLQSRTVVGHMASETPSAQDIARSDGTWSDYNDWQTAVRRGETKLKFEEWREEQK